MVTSKQDTTLPTQSGDPPAETVADAGASGEVNEDRSKRLQDSLGSEIGEAKV